MTSQIKADISLNMIAA
jgi:hypothetical protein